MTLLIDVARLLVFPAVMAFAASSDLFTMTISNRISLILVVGFVALAVGTGMPVGEMLDHAGAGGLVLAVSFTFYLRGWVGGGDAKLASAIALWFGFTWLFDYLVYAALVGGALTFLILQFRKWPLPAAISGQVWLQRLHENKGGIPYGIALAIGALMIYPETEWMKAINFTHLAMR
jgi:prepilin peptidase CpaA